MIILISGASHTGKTVLAQRLMQRGLDEKTVMDIYWNNAMGVMKRAVRNHP